MYRVVRDAAREKVHQQTKEKKTYRFYSWSLVDWPVKQKSVAFPELCLI